MIRTLSREDEPLFRDHLLRLDEPSRHDRFLSGVGDSFLVEYARRCFDGDTLVLGFLSADLVRAAGELHTAEPWIADTGEVGLSVEPELRNKGIGTRLLQRLVTSARNRGFRHLRMNCHPRNLAMQAIARKFEAELRIEEGATVGEIEAGPPNAFSLLREALAGVAEIGKAAIRLVHRG
jgi:GNAT superfamily N-acetyltransferase